MSKRIELMIKLPPLAKKRMENDKTKIVEAFFKGNEAEAYTKLQFARIYKGYDLLEDFGYVRHAIQRKYDISVTLLETILYLVPKNYFMVDDLREITQIRYTYKKVDTLIRLGYVTRAAKGGNKNEHLYTATAKARQICQEMHEMLAGEIPIPEELYNTKEASKSDLIKAEIIKKLNKKEKPKTVKLLWARKA
ncbi:hypothetical protein [Myroides odoratus]|uniref:Uncharacterized protein n=1 Tax=Myroides odoratus TaxID=256 RepID=A0A9Q6Z3W7_MYROD|nr:hypothetical protein [Myroides odoratus]EHQ41557.1 hypothetical protein Myrod_0721 [Myroides odoratus DSM 2801]EKB02746.1 hypothetical protein HMPREF9716_03679 [Myroides odoratus CIP 103059]QQT98975.1 hypothetical protein I6I88_12215 [Myroides odoratus]WQD58836.1 hypothetical protein U0010_06760 [Myroides odoratus]STZ28820.1 Uncharacterised protein [Myroides odoratus]